MSEGSQSDAPGRITKAEHLAPSRTAAHQVVLVDLSKKILTGGSHRSPSHNCHQVVLVEDLTKKVAEQHHAKEQVGVLKYSPDGTKLAAGSNDNFIYIYNVLQVHAHADAAYVCVCCTTAGHHSGMSPLYLKADKMQLGWWWADKGVCAQPECACFISTHNRKTCRCWLVLYVARGHGAAAVLQMRMLPDDVTEFVFGCVHILVCMLLKDSMSVVWVERYTEQKVLCF